MEGKKLDCGHAPSPHGEHTTGYAIDSDGKRICWGCCAVRDKEIMVNTGNSKGLPLYLTDYEVANWPGTLRFKVNMSSKGRHNIAGTRTDVWFTGPDGHIWHGVQYGEWTQIVHCKRTKAVV